jgi:NAD(P)-dependent dehydrogenase (short-subunit alcohol dehydrogenase family)
MSGTLSGKRVLVIGASAGIGRALAIRAVREGAQVLMADADADDLRRAFETNVIGFHQPMRACLPLLAPGAVVLVLSSESIDQPRSALGAYAASKQALERTVTAWRTEHPAIRFRRDGEL